MKESELNIKVSQKLQEFEAFTDMQPSTDWELSLMERLDNELKVDSRKSYVKFSLFDFQLSNFQLLTFKYAAVMLFLILINIGFIINMLPHNSTKISNKESDFKAISKELLINENSIRD